jgi:hypothetical protein
MVLFTGDTGSRGKASQEQTMRAAWRRGLAVAVTLSIFGCGGGSLRQVRGATFDLSGKETDVAEEYEQQEPKSAGVKARCEYWTRRVSDARGSHQIGVLVWPSEYFNTLRAWVAAKKDQACAAAEAESERDKNEKQAIEAKREATERWHRVEEEEAKKARETANAEVAAGRCLDNRHAKLQQALAAVKSLFREGLRMGSSPEYFELAAHRILVATERGAQLDFDSLSGGEHHLYAVSFETVRLDVRDRSGHPLVVKDPYEVLVRNAGGKTDSRVLELSGTEVPQVRVVGAGCALVMAFRKL